MVFNCSVSTCGNTGKTRKMYRFPINHPQALNIWLERLGNENLKSLDKNKLYNNYRVCDEHFDDSCVYPGRYSHLRLGSLPIKNLPDVGRQLTVDDSILEVLCKRSLRFLEPTCVTSMITLEAEDPPSPIKVSNNSNPKKVLIKSLKELELMSNEEVRSFHLGGASRLKVTQHIQSGFDYIATKHILIKESQKSLEEHQRTMEDSSERSPDTVAGGTKIQKRPIFEGITPKHLQKKVKSTITSKEPLISIEIAVVHTRHSERKLDTAELIAVQDAICEALDEIPINGTQVRFTKCIQKSGYLIFTCADRTSAKWLKNIVSTLQPWKGLTLRVLEGEGMLRPNVYTTFIPNDKGPRLESDRILHRLKICNHGLNTNLWAVWGKTPADNGQIWTFSLDQGSLEELEKLDMSPFYMLGRLKFHLIGDKTPESNRGQNT